LIKIKTSKFEKVYINKLFSSSESVLDNVSVIDSPAKYLASFECRVDKSDLNHPKTNKNDKKISDDSESNNNSTLSKAPCIIDLLNIK
jgi:hypothetical protein